MAEEADVQANQITLEDFEGKQDAPEAASSPAKTEATVETKAETKPEGEDTKAEPSDDTPTPPEVPTKGAEDPSEDEDVVPPDDKPTRGEAPTKADERKSQLNNEIRDLVATRNALKAEVEKANADVYQPATEKDLVDEGMSATEAKVEALRQQIEVRDYNERVAEAQLTIESESQRVLSDFSAFNPDSPEYDKELANEAAELLQQNLITDPNTGQIIGTNVSPYQLYKTLARASGISATKAQIKGQAAAEKQLANVDANSSAAPPKSAKDPLLEFFSDVDS